MMYLSILTSLIDSSPSISQKKASGKVVLKNTVTWPATLLLPDIMGWFAWIPMMECRHGVVNLDAVPRDGITRMQID